ncbi:MAG: hypothetical protein MZV70_12395, partial [Desulfobacterales bacterium]|nr:hypothetical protein [Desulfobacterales bacterium]
DVCFVQLRIAKVNLVTGTQDSSTLPVRQPFFFKVDVAEQMPLLRREHCRALLGRHLSNAR